MVASLFFGLFKYGSFTCGVYNVTPFLFCHETFFFLTSMLGIQNASTNFVRITRCKNNYKDFLH